MVVNLAAICCEMNSQRQPKRVSTFFIARQTSTAVRSLETLLCESLSNQRSNLDPENTLQKHRCSGSLTFAQREPGLHLVAAAAFGRTVGNQNQTTCGNGIDPAACTNAAVVFGAGMRIGLFLLPPIGFVIGIVFIWRAVQRLGSPGDAWRAIKFHRKLSK